MSIMHLNLLLQSIVIGEAHAVYSQLTSERTSNNDTIKELSLKACEYLKPIDKNLRIVEKK